MIQPFKRDIKANHMVYLEEIINIRQELHTQLGSERSAVTFPCIFEKRRKHV